jgi:hypothetical protein
MRRSYSRHDSDDKQVRNPYFSVWFTGITFQQTVVVTVTVDIGKTCQAILGAVNTVASVDGSCFQFRLGTSSNGSAATIAR